MPVSYEDILEKINHILDVANTLTHIQAQLDPKDFLFLQAEKISKNLHKAGVIWANHLFDHFTLCRQNRSLNLASNLTEKEQSLLRNSIATPINQALNFIEKISSSPNLPTLNQEILFLEQTQQILNEYLNDFKNFMITLLDNPKAQERFFLHIEDPLKEINPNASGRN